MTETPTTCTVRNAVTGACGKPAFYTEGEFAECYDHAHQHGSLYFTRKPGVSRDFQVGDLVIYKAYGGTYVGRIVRLGTKRADVTVTLQSGREKVLKNKKISDLKPYKL